MAGPERVRDETRVGTSEGAFRSMLLVDLLYRTGAYVIRMYGGVGGEEPRGFPLSRLGLKKGSVMVSQLNDMDCVLPHFIYKSVFIINTT